ncbi:MAG: tRNA (adenosine(37)-N6)-threonylcarbamoyltransferase complex ATPase subunit type 1 TsaE [Thiohalobacteraceae bacterium]
MTELSLDIADTEAMERLGAALGAHLRGGEVIYLRGDLGVGKTTLVRGLLRGRGHDGPVRSPTYTLVEPYELPPLTLYHLDLYRLADAEELEWIGIRDLLDATSVALVEWPERGRGVLPAADLSITIRYQDPGRWVLLLGQSAGGDWLVGQLIDKGS